jgi:hypothetical protein
MTFSLTSILPLPDMLALGWFFLCWVGYAWYADHRRWGTRELASVLHEYRLRWMRRVLERENRIADTVVLQTVMRSDNLFITTTLFIIAGLISSLGAVDRVQAMVSGIGFIALSSRETLEVRLLVLIGIFVFAFFKFTWSLRQFTHADAVRLGADAGGEGCAGPRRFRAARGDDGDARFRQLQPRAARVFFRAGGAGVVHPALGAGAGDVLGGGGALLARQPFGDAGHAGRAGDGEGTALRRGWRSYTARPGFRVKPGMTN